MIVTIAHVPLHRRCARILIVTGVILTVLDILRLFFLPPYQQSAFTDLYEAVVVVLGALACGFAAARSSSVTRWLWSMATAYMALNAVADIHDFLMDVHASGSLFLSLLEPMGWCVYLPLALLIFFPAAEEGRVRWGWLAVVDFAQVAVAIALVYFRFIYLRHVEIHQGWTEFGAPEQVRNVLLVAGLLTRAMVEPSAKTRSVYRTIGGAFATIVLLKEVFLPYAAAVPGIARPMALLTIGVVAADWTDQPERAVASREQAVGLRSALSMFSVATLIAVLYVAHDARYYYRGIIYSSAAISVALFVVRSFLAERSRHAIEKRLGERDERLRALFHHQVVGMAIISPHKRWLEVNDTWCDMMGYSREELTRMDWVALTHPDDVAADLERFSRILGGEVDRYTRKKRFIRKNGAILHAEISVDCVRRPDGALDYIVALATDVTERTQAQEQLRQAQKMEAIGHLAGGIAHDFNNLLAVILGNSEILQECALNGEVAPRAVQRINQAAKSAASLTAQLLAFSRRQALRPVAINPNEMVMQVRELLRHLIHESIELVIRTDPGAENVCADPGQLEQVILNLAVNARDAMPPGGILTIETQNVDWRQIQSGSTESVEPGTYVMLAVSDTGMGMDAQAQQHIFEPFYTTKTQGTGLGLATVHGIVRQSGGHISVHSEPGRGTTIKVFLPAAARPVEKKPHPIQGKIPFGTETILLVEDNSHLRELSREFLTAAGYQVLEAASGDQALAAARAHDGPIHLILTDVVLPSGNGPQVAAQVAALFPGIAVLFMSGHTSDVITRHGLADSHVALLQKPFTKAQLLAAVREALDRKHHATVAMA